MNHNHYDIVVIGGGPAGSTLSTLLVRQGYRVLLLEREKFPRFHVGESLLPTTQRIWEKLGIAEPMQHLGHTFKYAGEFRIGLDPRKSDYEYSTNRFNNIPRQKLQERPYAYQVERSEFDLFLLNHARQQGVTVYEEATVKEVLWEGEQATGIRWRTKEGMEYCTQVECVADCSGRHALIARSKKLLTPHPKIKTSAVFGHFEGVTRDSGIRQGYFNGYFIENGWFWFIPLSSDIMSVGVVMNEPETNGWSHRSPEEILLTYINRYQFIRDRFENAEQSSKIRMLRGLPYSSKQTVGNGWILVGDANFFVDPLYSSGVHIAFHSAEKAAEAIAIFLQGKRNIKPFKQYAKWSEKYQFHVFTTMSLLYGMLKDRVAMETYIKLSGKYSNHWNNPILRRVNAWGTGHFDKFYLALYSTWIFSFLLITIGKIRKILGIRGWDTHAEFCSEPPLQIPKSAELLQNSQSDQAQSPTPVNDVNYLDRWVVPSDYTDENSSFTKQSTSEPVSTTRSS
ncbi:MAG: putative FAD-dependent oxidoreductase LodB [Cyanobacteriota bacterium]